MTMGQEKMTMTEAGTFQFPGSQRVYDAPEGVGEVADILGFVAMSAMRCILQGAMVMVYHCDARMRVWTVDCDVELPRKSMLKWPEDRNNLGSSLQEFTESFFRRAAADPSEFERRTAALTMYTDGLGRLGWTWRTLIAPDQIPATHAANATTLRGLVNAILTLLIAPFASGADMVLIAVTPQSSERVGLLMYDNGRRDHEDRENDVALARFAARSKEWFYTTRVGVLPSGSA